MPAAVPDAGPRGEPPLPGIQKINRGILFRQPSSLLHLQNRSLAEFGHIFQTSVADPGSGAFLTPDPGSGIGFFRIPDPKPIFVGTIKSRKKKFSHPSLLSLFLDPGSGMDKNQDPG